MFSILAKKLTYTILLGKPTKILGKTVIKLDILKPLYQRIIHPRRKFNKEPVLNWIQNGKENRDFR